jgi:hypothetical protein
MVDDRTDTPPVVYFYYPLGADERDVPESRAFSATGRASMSGR